MVSLLDTNLCFLVLFYVFSCFPPPPPPPGSGFDSTKVWTSDGLWKGFLRCAKMMAKESGATSFIAMVQLPDKKLKEALAHPLMKVWPRLFRTHHR